MITTNLLFLVNISKMLFSDVIPPAKRTIGILRNKQSSRWDECTHIMMITNSVENNVAVTFTDLPKKNAQQSKTNVKIQQSEFKK